MTRVSSETRDPAPGPAFDPALDPLGAASSLDAGEEDPDAASTAALPGHSADEVHDDAPTGPPQDPPVGPPSQDH